MAIIAPQTAPNYSIGEYHRILRGELICPPGDPNPRWLLLVGFYASAYAREQAPNAPMYTNAVSIPFATLDVDPRIALYDLLMKSALFAGTNAAPDVNMPTPNVTPTEEQTVPENTAPTV